MLFFRSRYKKEKKVGLFSELSAIRSAGRALYPLLLSGDGCLSKIFGECFPSMGDDYISGFRFDGMDFIGISEHRCRLCFKDDRGGTIVMYLSLSDGFVGAVHGSCELWESQNLDGFLAERMVAIVNFTVDAESRSAVDFSYSSLP